METPVPYQDPTGFINGPYILGLLVLSILVVTLWKANR